MIQDISTRTLKKEVHSQTGGALFDITLHDALLATWSMLFFKDGLLQKNAAEDKSSVLKISLSV